MTDKPKIDALETEQLLKGMGFTASVVIHDTGLVTATAISGMAAHEHLQNEVSAALEDIQKIQD